MSKITLLGSNSSYPQRQTQGFDGDFMRSPQNAYRSNWYNGNTGNTFFAQESFDPLTFFRQSFTRNRRIPTQYLRQISRTIPVARAISKITNVVLSMQYIIEPDNDLKKSLEAEELTKIQKAITKAIDEPNREEHNTYHYVIGSIIESLLTIGFAAIERQDGGEDYKEQPFWWWDVDGALIERNPNWNATKQNLPRYYERDLFDSKLYRPIYDEHLFIITLKSNSYQIVPPSPLEVACNTVAEWLKLQDQNSRSTSNVLRQFILSLEQEMTEDELKGFREYWQNNVVNSGEVPIIAGKVSVTQLGASSDAELYPQYQECLLRMIALAFNLSVRDMNITESDNRATAGVAADVSFQDGIEPIAQLINRAIQAGLVGYYFPDWKIKYSNSEKRSEQEEAQRADLLFKGNLITLNEARQAIEMEILDPAIGDKFANGKGLNPEENAAMEQQNSGYGNYGGGYEGYNSGRYGQQLSLF